MSFFQKHPCGTLFFLAILTLFLAGTLPLLGKTVYSFDLWRQGLVSLASREPVKNVVHFFSGETSPTSEPEEKGTNAAAEAGRSGKTTSPEKATAEKKRIVTGRVEQCGAAIPSVSYQIFWGERFPKTLLAMIAGCGLALAGLTLQAVFRNPLATPYTLGIASGSAFGATLWLLAGSALIRWGVPPFFGGISLLTWSAFAGAMLSTGLVFGLSRRSSSTSDRMLLAGVAVNFFFSSLILALQYVSDPTKTFRMLRWTMGGIETCDPWQLGMLAGIVLFCSMILFFFSRELNILLTGKEQALAFGVAVGRLRLFLFFLTSLMVGAIVSVCGPIGFVGLMVPHACRLWVGNDHRLLIPTVFFSGAIFLGLCFTVSRIVVYPNLLPVGIITSLLGGPFFLCLLFSKSKRV